MKPHISWLRYNLLSDLLPADTCIVEHNSDLSVQRALPS